MSEKYGHDGSPYNEVEVKGDIDETADALQQQLEQIAVENNENVETTGLEDHRYDQEVGASEDDALDYQEPKGRWTRTTPTATKGGFVPPSSHGFQGFVTLSGMAPSTEECKDVIVTCCEKLAKILPEIDETSRSKTADVTYWYSYLKDWILKFEEASGLHPASYFIPELDTLQSTYTEDHFDNIANEFSEAKKWIVQECIDLTQILNDGKKYGIEDPHGFQERFHALGAQMLRYRATSAAFGHVDEVHEFKFVVEPYLKDQCLALDQAMTDRSMDTGEFNSRWQLFLKEFMYYQQMGGFLKLPPDLEKFPGTKAWRYRSLTDLSGDITAFCMALMQAMDDLSQGLETISTSKFVKIFKKLKEDIETYDSCFDSPAEGIQMVPGYLEFARRWEEASSFNNDF